MNKSILVFLLLCLVLPCSAQSGTGGGLGGTQDAYGRIFEPDANRTNWNPHAWNSDGDGLANPCVFSTGSEPVGPDGEPSPCSYRLASRQAFLNSIAPIFTVLMTILVVMLAIWKGPALLRYLVVRFSGA